MNVLLLQADTSLLNYSWISDGNNPVNITYNSNLPPLGLLYIGRSLEEEGHKVEILDLHTEANPIEKIKSSLATADIVGLSVNGENLRIVASISKEIKKIEPDIHIILGGSHSTFHPNRTLKDVSSADINVQGDGEFVIKDILKALEQDKNLSDIPGIFFRENGKIKKGKQPKLIEDLDIISFPARHLVDKYEYGKIKNIDLFEQKLTSFVSSRGCPFTCRFCSRHAFSYDTYRVRSVDNIIEEIAEIDEKYKSLVIVDDNFMTDKKRINDIMDRIIELKTDLDLIILGARVDSADKKLYKKMKKAGVSYIGFGLESGNQEILDYYRKKIDLTQIRNAINLAREMDFMILGNFILGAPVETEKQINNTIDFACSLPLDIAVFYPLFYMYGSDIWNEANSMGKISLEDGYSIISDKRRGLGNFTEDELRFFCEKAFKRFYYRPSYLIGEVIRSASRKNMNLLRIGIKNFLIENLCFNNF